MGRIGILWRGNRNSRNKAAAENNRLYPLFKALAGLGVSAEAVVYSDEIVDDVRDQLQQLHGVLVWVDPITDGQDRSKLDALLREVATGGVWVSAHPDVTLKMGTKEVLFRTRHLGWGSDTHLYATMKELREQFPARLASTGARVLKQHRGNGGIGVWKVELVIDDSASPVANVTPLASRADTTVRVQHARVRDTTTEEMRLSEFIDQCAEYFSGSGRMVDQPFQPRITEGMIRCYVVQKELVGFAHQSPDPLTVPERSVPGIATPGPDINGSSPANVFGLPSPKTMYAAAEPRFKMLRVQMESAWMPAMQRLLGIDDDCLPVIWDADFLYGPKTDAGEDTYVLCEINASCVYPFPEDALEKMAQAVAERLAVQRRLDSSNLV